MTRAKILLGAGVAAVLIVLYLVNPFGSRQDKEPARPAEKAGGGADERFLRDHRVRPEEPPPAERPRGIPSRPARPFPLFQAPPPPPPPARPRRPVSPPPPPPPPPPEPADLRVFHRDPAPAPPASLVRLPKGALLYAQLLETAHSDQPGPVTALVTRSFVDRGRVLIPIGTRAVGHVAAARQRQRGLELTWTDFYFPDGSLATLPGEPSTDATGGLPDARRRSRAGAKTGAALAAIATSVAVRAAQPEGSLTIAGSAAQEGAETAETVIGRWADRTLSAPPRLTLEAGSPIYIRVHSDVELVGPYSR
jgi:type IV secretion system protein VirB10